MKYWVYKDSRIMGPYDREAFAGLPGVDASTLVSVGDSGAGEGDWKLAGEIPDLAGLALDRPSWAVLGDGDAPAVQGMLDRLQIDAAGLVGDEDFPAGAEDLFQDAAMKKGFADLLAPRSGADEAELRRAKERAEELAYQVEALHKRLNELESSRAELMHRLAEQEARGSAPQAPLLPPAPAAAPVVPPPIAAAPVVPPPI
ncbi:MAG: hypothetical protein SF051_10055, partial [Elusimicrobiota bacterium]|nr:hypothetical protein [Elusimicrobiota bacterium]